MKLVRNRYWHVLTVGVLLIGGTVVVAGSLQAGEKTDKFWKNVQKKYEHESLVCLLDRANFDFEYTGDVVRQDASAQSDITGSRSATQALGSSFTTSTRVEQKYAILDEVAAARFQEWVIPLQAGQTAIRTSVEIVDTKGKFREIPDGAISLRRALPDESDLYSHVTELVFSLDEIPVPGVVSLYYTIEGENEYGYMDFQFHFDLPTYQAEFTYNDRTALKAQFNWLGQALTAQREGDRDAHLVMSTVSTPQGEMTTMKWTYNNIAANPVEQFGLPPVESAPRVMVNPNFKRSWEEILSWYSAEVEQRLASSGNDAAVGPIVREALENAEAAKQERLEAEAEAAAADEFDEFDEFADEDDEFADEDDEFAEEDDALGEEVIEEPADDLPSAELTDSEKIAALFRAAQEKFDIIPIKLGVDGYVPNRPVDTVNLERVTRGDLALFLVSMLRYAGFDADFGIATANETGGLVRVFPGLFQFDRALVVVKTEDDEFLLDPSDKGVGIEDDPASFEFTAILPIRPGTPDWLQTQDSRSKNNRFDAVGRINRQEDGSWVKSDTVEFAGEQNRYYRNRFYAHGANQGKVMQQNWLGLNFPDGAFVTGWDHDRGTSNDDPYRIVFDIKYPGGFVEEQGDTLVLKGGMFGQMVPAQIFPVNAATRKTVISFPFPESGSERVEFVVPEGYEVIKDMLPENFEANYPFGDMAFYYEAEENWVDVLDTLAVGDTFEVVEDIRLEPLVIFEMSYSLEPVNYRIAAEQAPDLEKFFREFKKNLESRVYLRKIEEMPES